MVQLEKISKSYGNRLIFSDVNFHVGKGERCAVVGRNGSGKSTLLKILAGVEEADSGNIHIPKGLSIGALPQHRHFDQPTLLEEAVLGLPENYRDEKYRVEIILGGLGFSEKDFSAEPESFSGGYQLRLSLCKVLAGEPDFLLLDEPTNYLDILAIRWLESFLCSWRGAILFVSHDRSFVNKVCSHILGIKRARIKKVKGNLDDYQTIMRVDEETYERTREKNQKKKSHMLSFVDRFGAKATKARQAQSRLKAVEKIDSLEALNKEQNLAFQFHYQNIQNKTILSVEGLSFAYEKNLQLIHGLQFEVERGERLAIIGKNGSGKSTLLRLISGELKQDSGQVNINQNAVIGYFGQTNIDRLNAAKTIEEELIHAFPNVSYAKVRSVCGAMLFSGDDAKKRISVLSGGEKSRVLLAKILLTPANLLLLDEPTHHLDMESVEALMWAIESFSGSVIIVSHDENVLAKFHAHKLIICHQEYQELFLGDYECFLGKRGWQEEGGNILRADTGKSDSTIQKSSQVSRLIKKNREKIERKIEKREEEKVKLEKMMMSGEQGVEFDIQELSLQFSKLSKDIDHLYDQLQKLYDEEE